jgi:hypothetical protein
MFKDVYETNNIGTLEIAKSLLRINDIEFQVKNELTLQTGSLEALGIQGAIISVDDRNFSKSKELLIENDLLIEAEEKDDQLDSMKWLDKNFNFSFLKDKPVILKLLFLVALLCLLLGGLAYVLILNNSIS